MKKKVLKLGIFIVLLFFGFQSFHIVKADHKHFDGNYDTDKHEKYEKYEKQKKYDDDWDDDDDWKDYYKSKDKRKFVGGTQQVTQPSYWNIWTRDTTVATNDNLPIQEAQKVTVEVNGKSEKLLVIPSNGQLLVSGEKMAQLLGVKYKFYEQSRILEMSTDNEELIVRANTNAAYENMVKTPMPTKAVFYENSVYLPISVMSNTFGYSVNWNADKSTFVLTKFN